MPVQGLFQVQRRDMNIGLPLMMLVGILPRSVTEVVACMCWLLIHDCLYLRGLCLDYKSFVYVRILKIFLHSCNDCSLFIFFFFSPVLLLMVLYFDRFGMKLLPNLQRLGLLHAFGTMDLPTYWDSWARTCLWELEGRRISSRTVILSVFVRPLRFKS